LDRFKRWRTIVVDYKRSGQPSTVICIEGKEQISQHIRDNRSISIDKILSEKIISHGKERCMNGNFDRLKKTYRQMKSGAITYEKYLNYFAIISSRHLIKIP
jgi:hypothetical protein